MEKTKHWSWFVRLLVNLTLFKQTCPACFLVITPMWYINKTCWLAPFFQPPPLSSGFNDSLLSIYLLTAKLLLSRQRSLSHLQSWLSWQSTFVISTHHVICLLKRCRIFGPILFVTLVSNYINSCILGGCGGGKEKKKIILKFTPKFFYRKTSLLDY